MYVYFVLILGYASFSLAQVPIPANKTCADICSPTVVNPKDVSSNLTFSFQDPKSLFPQLLGVWFLIKHIPYFFTTGSSCAYANFTELNKTHQNVQYVDNIK